MEYINLNSIWLTSPLALDTTRILTYYSPIKINKADVLYTNTREGVKIYRALVATNTVLRRKMIIGGTTAAPLLAGYISRIVLKEITEKHTDHPELHEKVCDALGVPY